MKEEYKKWMVIGLIIIVLSFSQSDKKEWGLPLLAPAITGLTYSATTLEVGGALVGTAMLPTPAAPIGMILIVISGTLLLLGILGFNWLTSNMAWIIIAIIVILMLKTIGKKRQG